MPIIAQRALKVAQVRPRVIDFVREDTGKGSHFAIATGREELAQAILLRLMEQKADWYFNPDFGLPWVDNQDAGIHGILGSKPPMSFGLIALFIRRELLKDKRIRSLPTVDVGWENENLRQVFATIDVIPITGKPFQVATVI